MPDPEMDGEILACHCRIKCQVPDRQKIGTQNQRPGGLMTLRYSINNDACQDEAGEPHVKPGERDRVGNVIGYLETQERGIGIGPEGKTCTRADQLHAERNCGCGCKKDECLPGANAEEAEEQHGCRTEKNMQ